ncbi:hypothetical protein BC828DRAFT_393818 [Blastocladiella britannica]|nr:hypothetical protein BC828DRAFT_393818 [Blastocladiella britannica]
MPKHKSSSHQYHHYIPQFILRNFAVDDHHKKQSAKKDIRVYSIPDKQTTVKKLQLCFGVSNMYYDFSNKTYPMAVEKQLANLEGAAAQVIHRILAAKDEFSITRADLRTLKKFLFIMSYRKDSRRNQYLKERFDGLTAPDIHTYMEQKGFAAPREVWLDNIKQILTLPERELIQNVDHPSKTLPDDKLYHAIAGELTNLLRCFLCVWRAEEGSEFVMTDNSFGLYEGFYPLAVHHFFYVVSPTIALVFCNPAQRETPQGHFFQHMHKFMSVPDSWFQDAPHAQPRPSYQHGSGGVLKLDPEKSAEEINTLLSDQDQFSYQITLLPRKMVHLVNLIALNEACEAVAFKSEPCLLKTLRYYAADPRSYKKDYATLQQELFRYVNRTHSNPQGGLPHLQLSWPLPSAPVPAPAPEPEPEPAPTRSASRSSTRPASNVNNFGNLLQENYAAAPPTQRDRELLARIEDPRLRGLLPALFRQAAILNSVPALERFLSRATASPAVHRKGKSQKPARKPQASAPVIPRPTQDEINFALQMAADNNALTAARYLLAHGADANAHTEKMYPLHLAVRCQNAAMVTLLLEEGRADPNVRAFSGATPLAHALLSGQADLAAILLKHGTDPSIPFVNEDGEELRPNELLGVHGIHPG